MGSLRRTTNSASKMQATIPRASTRTPTDSQRDPVIQALLALVRLARKAERARRHRLLGLRCTK